MEHRNTSSSQALLHLENNTESPLFVCKTADDEDLLNKLKASETKPTSLPNTKPLIAPPPKSQVISKLRDFLGVMAESNKKLEQDAMNSKNYDIEALTGDESEYIEMDLMLGVADLNTPEAVAAAESAILGYQPVISLDGSSSESESDDSSEDSTDDDNSSDETIKATRPPKKSKSQIVGDKLTNVESESGQKRKRSKIVELP